MRFTVLCNGDVIGEVELSAAEIAGGSALADLQPLPGFERYRPTLERAHRAMQDGAARLFELMQQGHVFGPSDQGSGTPEHERGFIEAHSIELTPEQAQLIGEAELAAAIEPATELRFSLRDVDGSAVAAEDVYVWTALGEPHEQSAPRVAVTFR